MKNYIIGGIVVILIAGFGFVIQSQRSEIRTLQDQLAAFESSGVVAQSEGVDGAQIDGTAKAVVSEVTESLEAEVSPAESSDEGSRRMMRGMSEMMKNPTMNKVMVASQKATLEVMYGELIETLDLKDAEKDYFMELLLSRQMVTVENAMKLMGGNVSDEERKEIQQRINEAGKEMREEMEYFLNNESDVAEWRFYEKTMGERMAISGFEQSLAQSEMTLPEGTGRKLVEAMHEEKSNFKFSTDLHDDKKMDMSSERFSEENIQKFKGDIEDLDTLIAERVMQLLSSAQFEQFVKSQEQMRQFKISQLQMAAQMFANQKK